MGLWLALLISFPIMTLALHVEQMLLAFVQTPNAARLAQQNLFGLAWGTAPMLCFQVIRCFMGAITNRNRAMWITLAAIPVNTMLVYLLIYGDLGLPRLELFGAGLATTLVNSGTLLTSLWFTTKRRPFCDYDVLAHLWRFDWPLMRQLIVIGTPIPIASLFGSGLYSAAALLAGRISTSALCAHQIAFQIAATLYMISFGISAAATVRVAHAVGCNDGPGIKRAGGVTMLFGAAIVAILALAVIAARFEIAQFFFRKCGQRPR